jgi:xanthine/uracil/vitamin C permease (AzgA family)
VTTFVTMAYIIVVNPAILASASGSRLRSRPRSSTPWPPALFLALIGLYEAGLVTSFVTGMPAADLARE